tara:strand:+ start:691 stop:1665 length:975 start_codon:yes stop_codon:yes gene_type:complete
MNSTQNNLDNFFNLYKLEKSNYNIIITGNNGCGKYQLIEAILKKYYSNYSEENYSNLNNNPDVHYISLPIYDSQNKIIRTLTNEEKILYKFGLIEKIEDKRIGKEISIDQIRSLINFTHLTSYINHKFVIINDCDYLNKEAGSALLKTLEETQSQTIFFLLTSSIEYIPLTIKSRCHLFNYQPEVKTPTINSLFEYFLFMYPQLNQISQNTNLLDDYKNIEEELYLIKHKELDPISLSDKWNKRGIIILDYLIVLFTLLAKGNLLPSTNPLKPIYLKISEKIKSTPKKSIYLIDYLIKRKKDLFYNVNKKLFFDDLLIVLSSKL